MTNKAIKTLGFVFGITLFISATSCKKDKKEAVPEEEVPMVSVPQLEFSLEFDKTLPRLGNFGEVATVPSGNAAQHPEMKEASIHYVEFATDSLTALGSGVIVYKGAETTSGGGNAVDIDNAIIKAGGESYVSLPLSALPAGTYKWIRVSLTYQLYDIEFRFNQAPYFVDADLTGRLASFVGFNNFITSHKMIDSTVIVNADKKQGYWAFETVAPYAGVNYGSVTTGDGAGVTVVNPISTSSPVPAGSCVVTGKLATDLVITGNETEDTHVVLAFSTNNSFEWVEVVADGKFEPGAGETVADMGLRGLHPYVK